MSDDTTMNGGYKDDITDALTNRPNNQLTINELTAREYFSKPKKNQSNTTPILY
jgi:hypothetical protein